MTYQQQGEQQLLHHPTCSCSEPVEHGKEGHNPENISNQKINIPILGSHFTIHRLILYLLIMISKQTMSTRESFLFFNLSNKKRF